MNPEVITKRVNLIIKYLNKLQKFASVTLEEYIDNFEIQLMVERLIELLVEASSDTNSYLLVQVYQTSPESYFDSFILAGKKGIITEELAKKLAQAAGMRNRLVHQYDEINHELVFLAITQALTLYPSYIEQIENYLNQ